MKYFAAAILSSVILACPTTTLSADEAGAGESGQPILLHVPVSEFWSGNPSYEIRAATNGPWDAAGLSLFVRSRYGGEFQEFPFLAEGAGTMVALIPGDKVRAPGIEYYIASTETNGKRMDRFCSPGSPHVVIVKPSVGDSAEKVRLQRHKGHRAELRVDFNYSNFGTQVQPFADQQGIVYHEGSYGDHYNVIEAAFAYRFLRTELYSIAFGYGMLGGIMGADFPARAMFDDPKAPHEGARPERPGVYYGFAKSYWELGDVFGIEPKLIMGASYEGFEVGGGLLLRMGSITRPHFDVALEGISSVGIRFITEFMLVVEPHLQIALHNEITNYPIDEGYGTLPSLRLTLLAGVMELTASVGYGIRKGYESGGLSLGGGLAFEL